MTSTSSTFGTSSTSGTSGTSGTIDLRSDTVTLPSDKMKEAMMAAELGDDVYREDPTVNHLQERVATLFGKEDALFVCSGTMGNLISLMANCQRGEQAVVGDVSHINRFEQSNSSFLGGLSLRAVNNLPSGQMDLDALRFAVNPDDVHFAKTSLICLENTWNGMPLETDYVNSVRGFAKEQGLNMHLDGARIFNAACAQKLTVAELVAPFDSIQFCFSKGLAAPVGSMIVGTKDFISQSRRLRKALGGGLRQAGILAAACMVSLDQMVDRLCEDHENAQLLAEGLATVEGISITGGTARTNMVFFEPSHRQISREDMVQSLKRNGILVGVERTLGIRAVTHFGITAQHISQVVERVRNAVAEISSKGSRVETKV